MNFKNIINMFRGEQFSFVWSIQHHKHTKDYFLIIINKNEKLFLLSSDTNTTHECHDNEELFFVQKENHTEPCEIKVDIRDRQKHNKQLTKTLQIINTKYIVANIENTNGEKIVDNEKLFGLEYTFTFHINKKICKCPIMTKFYNS